MISGISFWQIAIFLLIVLILFGGKRLRNLGGDLGASLKGFKNAMKDDDDTDNAQHTDKANIEHQSPSSSTAQKLETSSESHKDKA